MIIEEILEDWRKVAPFKTMAMVEQDLIISRALVCLYEDAVIRDKLVFRGGTALNKLFMKLPSRYSEDIDLVQRRAEPIGPVIDAMRGALESWLGSPKRKMSARSVKLIYKYEGVDGAASKLKIEINTTEHFQVLPLQVMPFSVDSEWFAGESAVVTYALEELMATKLRALYQRRKSRDLFDMWYVCRQGKVDIAQMMGIFWHYCAHEGASITKALFQDNLAEKCLNKDFRADMLPMLSDDQDWDFDSAYDFVHEQVVGRLK